MFTSASSNKVLRTTATLALALAGLVGQAAHADNLNPILGGGLGAVAGALVGQSVGGRSGAMIGAAVGGVAGVGIASNSDRRGYEAQRGAASQEPPRPDTAGRYQQSYQQAPVYGYREAERANYYPARDYGRHGWGGHERGWEHQDEYRRDWDHRGGARRGWDRRD